MPSHEGGRTLLLILLVLLAASTVCKTPGVRDPPELPLDDLDAAVGVDVDAGAMEAGEEDGGAEDGGAEDGGAEDGGAGSRDAVSGEADDEQPGIDLRDM
jgi:hypothetical protein